MTSTTVMAETRYTPQILRRNFPLGRLAGHNGILWKSKASDCAAAWRLSSPCQHMPLPSALACTLKQNLRTLRRHTIA